MLALLDERRDNVITQRTRLVDQLHALLRDLLPGGADTNLTAATAAALLARVRAAGPVETARKQLARDLIAEIRDADQRLTALTKHIAAIVAETGSQLTELDGVGPVIAGRRSAAPGARAASRPPRRSLTTPASRRSRSPAPTEPGTAFPATVTGN